MSIFRPLEEILFYRVEPKELDMPKNIKLFCFPLAGEKTVDLIFIKEISDLNNRRVIYY